MRFRVERWAALAALLLAASGAAGEDAPGVAGEGAPDPGFLEFLGLMVEDDGDYLDPLDLAEVALAEPGLRRSAEAGGTEDDDVRDN